MIVEAIHHQVTAAEILFVCDRGRVIGICCTAVTISQLCEFAIESRIEYLERGWSTGAETHDCEARFLTEGNRKSQCLQSCRRRGDIYD